jgi:uncharacterized protein YndB with AHSA1/START domain
MEPITIQATIQATKDKVWDYYTEPKHITNWNFASDDWCCPSATNHLMVGGKYSARMEARDGSFGFDFEGIYDEVVIGERIDLTFMDSRKMTVVFSENENNTRVQISFEPETENPIELQRDGWQMILNNFKKYTEGN